MQWFSLSKINYDVVFHVPFLDPVVVLASLEKPTNMIFKISFSNTFNTSLNLFEQKFHSTLLELRLHSDVRKIRSPRVTDKALYTSSWCCDSSGTWVAPVVSPRPADCNDVLEKFRSEDKTSLRRVGYWARGNSINTTWSSISAYLEDILAPRMGLYSKRNLPAMQKCWEEYKVSASAPVSACNQPRR